MSVTDPTTTTTSETDPETRAALERVSTRLLSILIRLEKAEAEAAQQQTQTAPQRKSETGAARPRLTTNARRSGIEEG